MSESAMTGTFAHSATPAQPSRRAMAPKAKVPSARIPSRIAFAFPTASAYGIQVARRFDRVFAQLRRIPEQRSPVERKRGNQGFQGLRERVVRPACRMQRQSEECAACRCEFLDFTGAAQHPDGLIGAAEIAQRRGVLDVELGAGSTGQPQRPRALVERSGLRLSATRIVGPAEFERTARVGIVELGRQGSDPLDHILRREGCVIPDRVYTGLPVLRRDRVHLPRLLRPVPIAAKRQATSPSADSGEAASYFARY